MISHEILHILFSDKSPLQIFAAEIVCWEFSRYWALPELHILIASSSSFK